MSSVEDLKPGTGKLYIGEGVTIEGEISVPDTLVVYGTLEGTVSAGNLIVGESGLVKGRIAVAQNAEISGRVLDRLSVKALMVLRSTSRVEANVTCGMLQIEQGATITGGISSTLDRSEQRLAKPEPARPEQKPPARSEATVGNGTRMPRQPDIAAME